MMMMSLLIDPRGNDLLHGDRDPYSLRVSGSVSGPGREVGIITDAIGFSGLQATMYRYICETIQYYLRKKKRHPPV